MLKANEREEQIMEKLRALGIDPSAMGEPEEEVKMHHLP